MALYSTMTCCSVKEVGGFPFDCSNFSYDKAKSTRRNYTEPEDIKEVQEDARYILKQEWKKVPLTQGIQIYLNEAQKYAYEVLTKEFHFKHLTTFTSKNHNNEVYVLFRQKLHTNPTKPDKELANKADKELEKEAE